MNYPGFQENWQFFPSILVDVNGDELSRFTFSSDHWYPCTLPGTVLGALVNNGEYPELYQGTNLDLVDKEQFSGSWWFRRVFELARLKDLQQVLLEFKGINYRANIWLNGHCLGTEDEIHGAFRHFSFNCTACICEGQNVLAIEVFPPNPGDFSTGFVDWNPAPPDRNMGLFKTVELRTVKSASISYPFVITKFDPEDPREATIDVRCQVKNLEYHPQSIRLMARIGDLTSSISWSLATDSSAEVSINSETDPAFILKDPKLWWPHQLGTPHLYSLSLTLYIDDWIADETTIKFGIRSVSDYLHHGHKGFLINGQKLLIKGAGWTDDLLLNDSHESLEAQIKYVKHLNLNCIRLEGIWGKDQRLFELCDQYGILMMVGWSCHWEHEQYLGKPTHPQYGGVFDTEDIDLIAKSWQDQVLWLRNHCSIFVWAVASDFLPHPDLEKKYQEIFDRYDPTRPYLNSTGGVGSEQSIISSSEIISEVSGSSGVKMLGPYAYTPPIYWYTDTHRGGAYGFNTETCPGANVPPIDSIRKMIPADHLWPVDEVWNFHCGLNEFGHLNRTVDAIKNRYGKPVDVNDFARKCQVLNYELMRPMFESFLVNHPVSTGVIQWMLNSAFPEMYWQLYDSYLMPNAAYFATRKACAPLHLLYHYGSSSIHLINELPKDATGLKYSIKRYNLNSDVIAVDKGFIDIEKQTQIKILDAPWMDLNNPMEFLLLQLFDQADQLIDDNFYWLSAKEDIMDYEAIAGSWSFYTPTKQYADLTGINDLPKANLLVKTQTEIPGTHNVTILNTSPHLAFFIELKIYSKDNQLVLPILWSDNYISLPPFEQRVVTLDVPNEYLNEHLMVTARGYNTAKHAKILNT